MKSAIIAILITAPAWAQQKPTAAKAPAPQQTLTPSAQEAVKLSSDWNTGSGGAASVSVDAIGRVKYAYGADMPTVVCAPLRICTIELEAGEHVSGDVQIGDAVRWDRALQFYGSANGAETPIIVLQPHATASETNLLVTTDRRVYYVRLANELVHPNHYMARVSFTYPEDQAAKWRQEVQSHEPAAAAPAVPVPPASEPAPAAPILANLCLDYKVKGANRSPCIRPARVYDDDTHTVIEMPGCVASRELPVLLIREDGKEIQTNYRYVNGKFVVDRLFDEAVLRAGSSKAAIKDEAKITRTKGLVAQ